MTSFFSSCAAAMVLFLVSAGCTSLDLHPNADQAFREFAPPLAGGSRLTIPVVKRARLANGLRIAVIEDASAATLKIAFADRAASDSGPYNFGLAEFTAAVMRESAEAKANSPSDLVHAVSQRHNQSGTTFQLTILPEQAAAGLDALAGIVEHPSFDANLCAKVRAELKVGYAAQATGVIPSLTYLAAETLFGADHPLAHPIGGTDRDRAEFKDDAAAVFYAARYQPNKSALLFVGSITLEQAVDLAQERFETWRPPAVASPPQEALPPLRPEQQRKPALAIATGGEFATFLLAAPCPARGAPDTIVADLAAELLGNLMQSGVRGRLRSAFGSSYTVSAQCRQSRNSGLFSLEFDTELPRFSTAVHATLAELTQLRTIPPSPSALAAARASYLGRHAESFGTSTGELTMLTDQFSNALPDDFYAQLEARVNAVTPSDVTEYAARWLKESSTIIAAEGEYSGLTDGLSQIGEVQWFEMH